MVVCNFLEMNWSWNMENFGNEKIKHGKNWKQAMGQVLSYSIDYKDHIKRIHLFDIEYDSHINKTCHVYNVKVTYETQSK